MELELEELKAAATEDEPAAAVATNDNTTMVCAFTRKKPSCKPFPAHLPRERVIMPGPTVCACCGSTRLAKLGEDVTETLEVVPRQWKVVQYVREKFTCRACEGISQAPAPFHVLPRGFAGPGLLAMILFEKYGLHQPLNRQAERYMHEGVELRLSTLADQVGGCAMVLHSLYDLIRAHVFAGDRVHGDDTPVPVLAKGKTVTGRLWTYVRDDRPSVAMIRRRRRFSIRATGPAIIPNVISLTMPGFSRLMPMRASADSMCSIVRRGRSSKLPVGRMRGASSLCLPTSPFTHAASCLSSRHGR
jgi:transposase